MLDFRLGQCLERKIGVWDKFRSFTSRPLPTIMALRNEVTTFRDAGVREFPILMNREIDSGLVVIVGCLPPKVYLGTLDDLLEICNAHSELTNAHGVITRESLWNECK